MRSPARRHLLLTTDAVGGVWRYSIELAGTLAVTGYRVTVATLGPAPSQAQVRQVGAIPNAGLIATDLPLDWLSEGAGPVRQAAEGLADLARSVDADLLHCNTPALVDAAMWPVPVVTAGHGCVATWWRAVRRTPLDPSFHWHRDMVRRGLLAADAVIAPSQSFASDLRQTYELPFTPQVVPNGRRSAAHHGSSEPSPTALTVGRLWDEAKNSAVLDRAAGLARTPIFAAGATHGPNGEAFTPTHLQVLGHVGERKLAALLSNQPVFVSAATFEPFGLAVLEAAAAGCALVLSDIGTFRELWNGAAVFVDADDAGGFAAAVDRLVEHPAEREKLGGRAREHALRYTAEACAAATMAVYDRVLAHRQVAA